MASARLPSVDTRSVLYCSSTAGPAVRSQNMVVGDRFAEILGI